MAVEVDAELTLDGLYAAAGDILLQLQRAARVITCCSESGSLSCRAIRIVNDAAICFGQFQRSIFLQHLSMPDVRVFLFADGIIRAGRRAGEIIRQVTLAADDHIRHLQLQLAAQGHALRQLKGDDIRCAIGLANHLLQVNSKIFCNFDDDTVADQVFQQVQILAGSQINLGPVVPIIVRMPQMHGIIRRRSRCDFDFLLSIFCAV